MKKPLIYVIEDDDVYLKVIKHKLDEYKLNNLKIYHTGKECLEEIGKHPKYLILDFSLPDLNGLDVLREVKKVSRNTRVILFTALEDQTVAQKCLQEGAYDYIIKNEEGVLKLESILEKISTSSLNKNLVMALILFILIGLLIIFLLTL